MILVIFLSLGNVLVIYDFRILSEIAYRWNYFVWRFLFDNETRKRFVEIQNLSIYDIFLRRNSTHRTKTKSILNYSIMGAYRRLGYFYALIGLLMRKKF